MTSELKRHNVSASFGQQRWMDWIQMTSSLCKFGMRVKTARKFQCSSSVTNQRNLMERQLRFNAVSPFSPRLVRGESLTISLLRLVGYGGFAISATPFFSPVILTFMKTYNAILAVPNIRGGGEFGGEWHKAGRRETKVCAHCLIFPVNKLDPLL